MSRRERAKRTRRRTKTWVYREYVGLPRGVRKRTDPIVRRINKSKPGHKKRAQKGKEEVVKRLKRFGRKLDGQKR